MPSKYDPKPEHKFTFGLWTVGNVGADAFGEAVRAKLTPADLVYLLGEVGAYGVNFHDNDLIPIDATPTERATILKAFKKALADTGLVVPMATTNLFGNPVFKDGAFTANDPQVRAYALQKTMNAIDLGVELGAEVYVFWGGREGIETDAAKSPVASTKRFRETINFLCDYVIDQGYDLKFALEAKPNEPRGDMYFATTGAYLGFIETLDHPEMVGVNPEMAHEHMAGLNFLHAVAQAWEAGKLFHIDLNDQNYARFDQDWRFGAQNLKPAFLPGEVPGGCRVSGKPPFRRPRLPHRGLRGRQGFRSRLHAHLPDPQGEGRAVQRRFGNPGAAGRDQCRRWRNGLVQGSLLGRQGRRTQGPRLRP